MRLHALLVAALVLTVQAARADQKLDAANEQALQQTQSLLGDQKAMQDYAKTHPDAAKSMDQVKTLTGGNEADSQAVYKLASEMMANMTKETNGDAAGMEKILSEAMKNPESFANKLSPEQRQQLQSLSKSIESRGPTSAPH